MEPDGKPILLNSSVLGPLIYSPFLYSWELVVWHRQTIVLNYYCKMNVLLDGTDCSAGKCKYMPSINLQDSQ